MAERYDAESPDIKSDIASAIAAAVASNEAEAAVEQPETATVPEADAPEATADAVETPESPPAEAKDDGKPETEEKPEEKGIEPPSNWAAADKEKFKSAPPELQSWLLDRHKSMEADYTKKTQEIAAFRTEYGPVDKMFEPWRDRMKQSGYSPSSLIRGWANVEQRLMNGEGVKVLSEVARSYKVDPAQLATALGVAQSQAQPGNATEAKPTQTLPPEVANELSEIRSRLNAREQADILARINQVNGEIETFKTATDEKGVLLHPHWDAAYKDIEILAEGARISGQKTTLQEMYDKAVWGNLSLRDAILSERQAADKAASLAAQQATEKKAQDEARAKAARAKKAGSSVTGAPGTGQSAQRVQSERSLRDELNANLAEVESAAA